MQGNVVASMGRLDKLRQTRVGFFVD